MSTVIFREGGLKIYNFNLPKPSGQSRAKDVSKTKKKGVRLEMGGRGSGGHNRKSTWQHILEGTYRQDRHGPKPDVNPLKVPDNKRPPRWFSPEAKKHFKKLLPQLSELGTLDRINLGLFEALCVTLGFMDELRPLRGEKWAERLYNQYTNEALRLFRIFGMTPAARSKLGLTIERRGEA